VPVATLRGVQLAVRAATAAGLSVAVAQYLQLPFPIYAMIAAVIVSDLSPAETRRLGLPRLAGTVVGATVGASLTPFLPPHAGTMALGVLLAMFLTHLVRLPQAAKVSGYVCGIILLDYDDHPWVYAQHRFVETVLGVVIAILVSMVPKLIPEAVAEKQ
jgi:uncharacterized membrane protein YgaE (UPF0421/DUF939 family)